MDQSRFNQLTALRGWLVRDHFDANYLIWKYVLLCLTDRQFGKDWQGFESSAWFYGCNLWALLSPDRLCPIHSRQFTLAELLRVFDADIRTPDDYR